MSRIRKIWVNTCATGTAAFAVGLIAYILMWLVSHFDFGISSEIFVVMFIGGVVAGGYWFWSMGQDLFKDSCDRKIDKVYKWFSREEN